MRICFRSVSSLPVLCGLSIRNDIIKSFAFAFIGLAGPSLRALAQSLGSTQPDPFVNLCVDWRKKGGVLPRGGDFRRWLRLTFAGIRAFLPATDAYPVTFGDVFSVRGGILTDLS